MAIGTDEKEAIQPSLASRQAWGADYSDGQRLLTCCAKFNKLGLSVLEEINPSAGGR